MTTPRLILRALCVASVLVAPLAAQGGASRDGAAPLPLAPTIAIDDALRQFVADKALANARIGVVVRDLASGETLLQHDADKGFMTASNMKLISAAVALQLLSPTFRWRTTVRAAASPDAAAPDTIHGDVFLRGGGDPTLGGPSDPGGLGGKDGLEHLAALLHERGIRRITGAVRGDASAEPFAIYGNGWQWDYLEEDYAAPSASLNFAQNVMTVLVHAGAPGKPSTFTCEPAIPTPWLHVNVHTVASKGPTGIRFWREPHRDRVVVDGTLAAETTNYRVPVAVADPARFAAEAFVLALARRGIKVEGGVGENAAAPRDAAELCAHESAPLSEVAVPLLQQSINLYAEQAWRAAAFYGVYRGQGHRTFAECERQALKALASMGVPTDGMELADGSGLSRRSLVQPQQLAALLAHAHGAPQLAALRAGLPVAGESGTLRSRFARGAAKGHVRAKTGFVSYVIGLSGYVDKKDGSAPLVFSILVNNFTCESDAAKAAVDAFVEQLARHAGWQPD